MIKKLLFLLSLTFTTSSFSQDLGEFVNLHDTNTTNIILSSEEWRKVIIYDNHTIEVEQYGSPIKILTRTEIISPFDTCTTIKRTHEIKMRNLTFDIYQYGIVPILNLSDREYSDRFREMFPMVTICD